MVRSAFVGFVLTGFVGLATIDLAHGNLRLGIASACLAAANVLLLVGGA